jgi:hypothetical protein
MRSVQVFRPRLVIRIGKDKSLDFAATSDIEVIIVREGFGNFRAFPTLKVGIEHVRRLLSGRPDPRTKRHMVRKTVS